MQIEQKINACEMDLCRYTLRQSICDTGEYPEFQTAQQILEELENGI